MAYVFNATDSTYTGPTFNLGVTNYQVMFYLKALAKSTSGTWTVAGSGDGLSAFSNNSDVLTSAGTSAAANRWGPNARAWFVLKHVTGASICIQLITAMTANSAQAYRIKFSQLGFDMTTANATTTPGPTNAGDEFVRWGGGTDASPTNGGTSWAADNDNTYRFNATFDNDTSAARMWMATWVNTTLLMRGCMFVDSTIGRDTGDTDKNVFYAQGNGSTYGNPLGTDGLASESTAQNSVLRGPVGWINRGGSPSGFTVMNAMFFANLARNCVGTVGTSPKTGRDEFLPVFYIRSSAQAAPTGFKGISDMLRWRGDASVTGDVRTESTTNDWVLVCDVWLPWLGDGTAALK